MRPSTGSKTSLTSFQNSVAAAPNPARRPMIIVLRWRCTPHIAESDQKAPETAESTFNLYVESRLYAKKSTYDDAMHNGLQLFGSVDTVARKLIALKEMGVGHVMALQNFGLLPQKHVHASMERLMKEVMPIVNSETNAKRAVA